MGWVRGMMVIKKSVFVICVVIGWVRGIMVMVMMNEGV